jgi:hypothetical protein
MLTINVLGLANLHPFRFSAPEVCELCGFSERTFFHRVKAGKIKVTHDEQNRINDGRRRIYVAGDDLAYYFGIRDEAQARARMGLPAIAEEKPEPEDDRKIFADVRVRDTKVVAAPSKSGTPTQGFSDDAAENLERWNAGELTDSAGNNGQGRNDRFPSKGTQTLLGPQEPMSRVRPDTTSHMVSPVGGGERIENAVDSDAFLEMIHPGSADRKSQMYQQCGVRPMSQQQQKEYNDKLALHAAFRWSR